MGQKVGQANLVPAFVTDSRDEENEQNASAKGTEVVSTGITLQVREAIEFKGVLSGR
ncbi:hypothetical protein CCACVL1_14710 [Corchorus capsularis]|uniref:Uncharacterized protein n=1 Tax=Corchorus capsularis TaxID=210143 RepID=A0A1R3I5Y8_COCAP|nr:hypothetical protein CCACVL1_14710 [Corchorus capsularis]